MALNSLTSYRWKIYMSSNSILVVVQLRKNLFPGATTRGRLPERAQTQGSAPTLARCRKQTEPLPDFYRQRGRKKNCTAE
jgi:hypothetical protein